MTDYSQRVPIPQAQSINSGLSYCPASTWLEIFGPPRKRLTDDCEAVTNAKLKHHLVQRDVGPFNVYGLDVVCDKLTRIFEKVQHDNPELYAQVSTAGVLCCRRIRGSQSTPSNHAFGGAIDLKINGRLDGVGDGQCQLGLLKLYPYFHNEGFYWGAEFRGPREDAMHFELAEQTVRRHFSKP